MDTYRKLELLVDEQGNINLFGAIITRECWQASLKDGGSIALPYGAVAVGYIATLPRDNTPIKEVVVVRVLCQPLRQTFLGYPVVHEPFMPIKRNVAGFSMGFELSTPRTPIVPLDDRTGPGAPVNWSDVNEVCRNLLG